MRLRRPCEHDRYDAHFVADGLPIFGYSGDVPLQCLGGEFLPEDALVIEKDADGKWPKWFQEAFELLVLHRSALAVQVGEPG